jgi:hypothetical protein
MFKWLKLLNDLYDRKLDSDQEKLLFANKAIFMGS